MQTKYLWWSNRGVSSRGAYALNESKSAPDEKRSYGEIGDRR